MTTTQGGEAIDLAAARERLRVASAPEIDVHRGNLIELARSASAIVQERSNQLASHLWKDAELVKFMSQVNEKLGRLQQAIAAQELDAPTATAIRSVLARITRPFWCECALETNAALGVLLISMETHDETLARVREEWRTRNDLYGWNKHLEEEDLKALQNLPRDDADRRKGAVANLQTIERWRNERHRHDRARLRIRMQYFMLLVCALFGLLVVANLVAALKGNVSWGDLFTILAMGAVGGSLAAFYRLRDHAATIGRLKSLAPIFVTQPVLGATSAFLLYILLRADAVPNLSIHLDVWYVVAGVGFVGGFCEALFLGVTKKLAGAVLDDPAVDAKAAPAKA